MTGYDARAQTTILQAASICLQYPDHNTLATLPVTLEAVSALAPGTARERLSRFLDHATTTAPDELARYYVEVFDMRRKCCLYLTWWTDGETRRRGSALAALKARYRVAGLDLQGGELPDFLPVVLEYSATGDLADGLALLQEHRAGIELLRLALLDIASPYAGLVETVCSLLPGPSPADVATAKALARNGPPREQVGLDLAPFQATIPVGLPR